MRRPLQWIYAIFIWLLMIGMVVQVFLAGYGAFGGGFGPHLGLAWVIAYTIVLLLVVAVIASLSRAMPWPTTGITGILALLWIVQLVLAHTGVPAVSGLHAVNALIMLGVGGFLAGRARRMLFGHEAEVATATRPAPTS